MTTEAATATAGETTAAAAATTTAATAAQTTAATTTAAAATETGKGAETAADWRAGITDADHIEFAKRITSPADAIKVAYDLRKANSSMIRVPDDKASDEDKAKFRKAIGVPDKVEDYKFEYPDGYQAGDADKAVEVQLAKVFHEAGTPNAVAAKLNKIVVEMKATADAEAGRVEKKAYEDGQALLKREYGSEYDAKIQLANRALSEFGGADAVKFLQETKVAGARLSDHPALVRLLATVGQRMGEAEFIGEGGSDKRATLQQEADQLMRDNPPGTDRYKNPAVQKRLQEINRTLHGSAPVVGNQGRTA